MKKITSSEGGDAEVRDSRWEEGTVLLADYDKVGRTTARLLREENMTIVKISPEVRRSQETGRPPRRLSCAS
jgi:hypothetical protein